MRNWFLLFVLIFVFFILTVIVVCTLCYKSIYSTSNLLKHEKAMDSLHLLESSSSLPAAPHFPSSSLNSLNELTFSKIIGRGKYGTVWKGTLRSGTTVAIKVVGEESKRYLANECRIYSLPFMTDPSLGRFFGYMERFSDDGQLECCMALEYGHQGSLFDVLQQHTLDWQQLCRLAKSLAQGLAYLHCEVSKDNKLKPAIAHRDLCSRNVIVRADGMSCMICDFQFAVCFANSKPLFPEERSTCAVVGTLRYLSPELLEGAINLYHCESALKQADVYSLGLILWEMASRCSDLYQGIDVPSYKMPFEKETGQHVTFDQLRVLVGRHKARPLFPDIWKDSNPAIRLLKETIVECWDPEPEARLTALCITERIDELPLLWRRFKSETLANCCIMSSMQQLRSIENRLNSSTTGSCKGDLSGLKASPVLADSLEGKCLPSTCYINKFENSLHYKYNSHHHLLHHPYHKHHFYQANLTNSKKQDLNLTVEKNMTASANMSLNGATQPKLSLPLQPHLHGRNLCNERNLMSDLSDEYDGLLEHGMKFQTKSYLKSNVPNKSHEATRESNNEENDASNGHAHLNETRALIRTPLPLPISYVQNETSSQSVKAKETNKYQNRQESSSQLSSKSLSLFEYIKQKLNLTNHSKSSREKVGKEENAKQSIGSLLEEWKSCEENLDFAAVQMGSLLYAKESPHPSLDFSSHNVNVRSTGSVANPSEISDLASSTTSQNGNNNNPSHNSSPMISASEGDLSLLPSDLLSKDKLAQLTNSSCIPNNDNKQVERINNRCLDSLSIFLGASGKLDSATTELVVTDESQLLHSHGQ